MKAARVCELCNNEASLYCASDSAFLCFHCDAHVHRANFLVARHPRRPICPKCNDLADNPLTGAVVFLRVPPFCRACSSDVGAAPSLSPSEASACISSTESFVCTAAKKIGSDGRRRVDRAAAAASSSSVTDVSGRSSGEVTSAKVTAGERRKKRGGVGVGGGKATGCVDAKAEGVLADWCARMGLDGNSAVVPLATRAMGWCLGLGKAWPSKVLLLATSFWLGLKLCGNGSMCTYQNLRRLEEVSGVPAKLILTVGVKMARRLLHSARRVGRHDYSLEEGWAEC